MCADAAVGGELRRRVVAFLRRRLSCTVSVVSSGTTDSDVHVTMLSSQTAVITNDKMLFS